MLKLSNGEQILGVETEEFLQDFFAENNNIFKVRKKYQHYMEEFMSFFNEDRLKEIKTIYINDNNELSYEIIKEKIDELLETPLRNLYCSIRSHSKELISYCLYGKEDKDNGLDTVLSQSFHSFFLKSHDDLIGDYLYYASSFQETFEYLVLDTSLTAEQTKKAIYHLAFEKAVEYVYGEIAKIIRLWMHNPNPPYPYLQKRFIKINQAVSR